MLESWIQLPNFIQRYNICSKGCWNFFIFYAKALYNTILPALNDIRTQQAQPTQKTKQVVQQLLDYANTYKNVFLQFYASNMQLHVDTNAAFLLLPKAQSRIAGYFSLLCIKNSTKNHYVDNGPLLIKCKSLCLVITSAVESETHGGFINTKKSIPILYMLEKMEHKKNQPTLIRTDNSTSVGFVNKNMQMRQFKAWDMQLYWLCYKQNN